MKKGINIFYILLGIGIGLVIGSSINLLKPNIKYIEYTDDEIRKKARELGMYDLEEIIQVNSELNGKLEENQEEQISKSESSDNKAVDSDSQNDNDSENQIEEEKDTSVANDENEENEDENIEGGETNNSEEEEEVEYYEFIIHKGDSSEEIVDNLFEANIIDDKEEFIKVIIHRKAGRKFQFGNFLIPTDAEYNEVIDILLNIKN